MSFRLKIIIGVALIQGTLLLLLTWSSVQYLIQTNQQELAIRNETLTHSVSHCRATNVERCHQYA